MLNYNRQMQVEAGLRVRLDSALRQSAMLDRAFTQLLNAHMAQSKEFDELEAVNGILVQHLARLAHQCASDCQKSDDCYGCAWADGCRVAEYYNDCDVDDYRQ